MVNKLFKYEFSFYLKRMLPIYFVIFGTALMNRLIQVFESDELSYRILFVSASAAVGITIVVGFVMFLFITVIRFYRNLFLDEGYLTLTLPVGMDAQIRAKYAAAILYFVITAAVALLALGITTVGDVFSELVKAAVYLYRKCAAELPMTPLYIGEFLIGVLLSVSKIILLLYACIALGHLAKKNRISAAVGIFIAWFFFCLILFTFFTILIFAVWDFSLDKWFRLFNNDENLVIQSLLCLHILRASLFSAVYYFITVRILKRRLNLA